VDARNSGFEGEAALNYFVAKVEQEQPKPGLWLQYGRAAYPETQYFAAKSSLSGDQWRTWEEHFDSPFVSPPLILVTANADQKQGEAVCAPVGIASRVSPYSFVLAARSSDCGPGEAGFDFVAIGCPQCGEVPYR
jgi:hypothetical protein